MTQLYRGELFLRGFDDDVRRVLAEEMRKKGIDLRFGVNIASHRAARHGARGDARPTAASSRPTRSCSRPAARRTPQGLGLEEAGVALDARGAVVVDELLALVGAEHLRDRRRHQPHQPDAGRDPRGRWRVAATLFGGRPTAPDHERRADGGVQPARRSARSASPRPRRARATARSTIYRTSFRPLKHTLTGRDEKTMMKLVVDRATERVVGCHMVGPDAGEIIQGARDRAEVRRDQGAVRRDHRHPPDRGRGVRAPCATPFAAGGGGGAASEAAAMRCGIDRPPPRRRGAPPRETISPRDGTDQRQLPEAQGRLPLPRDRPPRRGVPEGEPRRAKVIRLGIGDVTEPLPAGGASTAMHAAVDEMGSDATLPRLRPGAGLRLPARGDRASTTTAPRGVDDRGRRDLRLRRLEVRQRQHPGDLRRRQRASRVTDPVYPVYVDTNVMAGRTGAADDDGALRGPRLPARAPRRTASCPSRPTQHVDLDLPLLPEQPDRRRRDARAARSAGSTTRAQHRRDHPLRRRLRGLHHRPGDAALDLRDRRRARGARSSSAASRRRPASPARAAPSPSCRRTLTRHDRRRRARRRCTRCGTAATRRSSTASPTSCSARAEAVYSPDGQARRSREHRSTSTWTMRASSAKGSTRRGLARLRRRQRALHLGEDARRASTRGSFFDRLLDEAQRRRHAGHRLRRRAAKATSASARSTRARTSRRRSSASGACAAERDDGARISRLRASGRWCRPAGTPRGGAALPAPPLRHRARHLQPQLVDRARLRGRVRPGRAARPRSTSAAAAACRRVPARRARRRPARRRGRRRGRPTRAGCRSPTARSTSCAARTCSSTCRRATARGARGAVPHRAPAGGDRRAVPLGRGRARRAGAARVPPLLHQRHLAPLARRAHALRAAVARLARGASSRARAGRTSAWRATTSTTGCCSSCSSSSTCSTSTRRSATSSRTTTATSTAYRDASAVAVPAHPRRPDRPRPDPSARVALDALEHANAGRRAASGNGARHAAHPAAGAGRRRRSPRSPRRWRSRTRAPRPRSRRPRATRSCSATRRRRAGTRGAADRAADARRGARALRRARGAAAPRARGARRARVVHPPAAPPARRGPRDARLGAALEVVEADRAAAHLIDSARSLSDVSRRLAGRDPLRRAAGRTRGRGAQGGALPERLSGRREALPLRSPGGAAPACSASAPTSRSTARSTSPGRCARYAYFVLHRVPFGPDVDYFVREARRAGRTVLFDTDDWVFDISSMPHVAALEDMLPSRPRPLPRGARALPRDPAALRRSAGLDRAAGAPRVGAARARRRAPERGEPRDDAPRRARPPPARGARRHRASGGRGGARVPQRHADPQARLRRGRVGAALADGALSRRSGCSPSATSTCARPSAASARATRTCRSCRGSACSR